MDLLIAFVVFLLSMVVCLTTGASMLIALAIGMVCFSAVALKRGFPLEDVLRMILSSTRRSFIVLRVLLLIGLVTALWRTSGTIAFFVYYGVQLITPHFFVLIAFVLSAVLSYALGTSFGVEMCIRDRNSRRSSILYRCMTMRSRPMPKAKPE